MHSTGQASSDVDNCLAWLNETQRSTYTDTHLLTTLTDLDRMHTNGIRADTDSWNDALMDKEWGKLN